MDGRRILLLVRRAWYSIGRYHRLVPPRACMYRRYLCMYAVIHTAAIPITANFREKTRPSSRSDQSYRACYLLVHRAVEVQLTGTHRRAWTCRYCRAGLVPATCE